MICPWKFKGCWYVLESLKGVDLLESLPTSPIFVFLLWNWHFLKNLSFALFQYFLLHRFQFSCHTICIGCEPGLENFQFVKYWKIGELPKQSTAKIVNKTAKTFHYTDWENLEKRLYVFHQKHTYILYYITEYNILLKLTETRSFHNIFNWLRERSDGDFVLKYSIICLHV